MPSITSLIPSKKLRVAINFGNAVLVQRTADQGFTGVSVTLAEFIANQLNVEIEYRFYESAGDVVNAAQTHEWDIAFLARDKERAIHLGFTAPYVVIEGAYLVNNESPYRLSADLDQPGKSVSVGKNAAYDLFLTRHLQHAKIVRAPTTPLAVDYFIELGLDAGAGVRAPLLRFAAQHPQYRVLDDSFMTIFQALAFHRSLEPLRDTLEELVEAFKLSGQARTALDDTNQFDADVAELSQNVHFETI